MRTLKNINEGRTEEKIIISINAINKLMTIADFMEDYEFSVFPTSSREDRIIDDFYIPYQTVEKATVDRDGLAMVDAFDDIRQKKKLFALGLAHGHGGFDPYHSLTDHQNFYKIGRRCNGSTRKCEYLDISLKNKKLNSSMDKYFIEGFNEIGVQLVADKDNISREELELLKQKLDLRVVKNMKSEVSSIVVNRTCKEIYGLKRFTEYPQFFLPGEEYNYITSIKEKIQEQDKFHPDDKLMDWFSYKDGTLEYSLDAIVEQVDLHDNLIVDRNQLISEFKEKLAFNGNGSIPSAFTGNVSDSKKEAVNQEYESKDYKKQQEQNITPVSNTSKNIASDVRYAEINADPKTDDKGCATEEIEDMPIKSDIITGKTHGMTAKIKDIMRNPFKKKKQQEIPEIDYKAENPYKEIKTESRQNPGRKRFKKIFGTRIFRRDPVEEFDVYFNSYEKYSKMFDSNYIDLNSTNRDIEVLKDYLSINNPNEKSLYRKTEELYNSNCIRLETMKSDFLEDISSTYREIRDLDINPLGRDELRDAYRSLLKVRNGFYSTNQDKIGDEANVLLRDIQKKYLKMKKNDTSRN